MTSGQSALKAIRVVKKKKCKIVKVMALVDRLEGARENLARHKHKLVSIFNKDNLINGKTKARTIKRKS